MATKPSIVPTWNTGGANNTAPTAPKIVLGFTNGERAAGSYFNNRLKLLGEWCQYLSDGALTGAHTFGSTVGITGAVTCSSTLGVTGAATFTAAITANGGVVAGSNQNITVSGTGRHKHGDMELAVSAAAFQVACVASQWAAGTVPEFDAVAGEWTFSSSLAPLAASVPLPVGKRIKSITWAFSKGSNATGMVFRLRKRTGSTTTTVATLTNTTSGASFTTDTMAAINYTIEAGYRVWLDVTPGHAAHAFEGANITFDD